VQQLEEENRVLRESREELKSQLARVEGGPQSAVSQFWEAIIAGGSKVTEDSGNLRRDVATLKEDMIVASRMRRREPFAPSMKKGKLRMSRGTATDEMYDIPREIISPLTKTCQGNAHDSNSQLVRYCLASAVD
jgi:hypothetical protein